MRAAGTILLLCIGHDGKFHLILKDRRRDTTRVCPLLSVHAPLDTRETNRQVYSALRRPCWPKHPLVNLLRCGGRSSVYS